MIEHIGDINFNPSIASIVSDEEHVELVYFSTPRSLGGTPPPTFRSNRTYSSSSLQSMSASINVYFCPHRMHYKLENLKTLKLSHNRLVTMRLALEADQLDDSSTEETPRPPSGQVVSYS